MANLEKLKRPVTAGEREDLIPEVGDWFWVPGRDDERWLGCVTHVGTNYVCLKGPSSKYSNSRQTARIHFDDILTIEPEPDAEAVIQARIAEHQGEVQRLLRQARDLTARLAIQIGPPSAASETQALALRGEGVDIEEYKGALIKAKEETLPEIFRAVKSHNEMAAAWMGAGLIPLEAQAEGSKTLIKAIEHRIFNVELYAGLVEQVEQVADGPPAPPDTPIHLLQRRAYMDEECLARYEVGGMEFKDIRDFDNWMARPENRDRLLPHPRCVLAMRVRRYTKEREAVNIRAFIAIIEKEHSDRFTYLYLRNGEQLFRLSTGIEFDEQLFPDSERIDASKPLYFEVWGNSIRKFISEGEYEHIVEEHERRRRNEEERIWASQRELDGYERYSPESVYYDDATKELHSQIAHHNRLVLILQGLLDRSPVFYPHPPWQLSEEGGFRAALRLVYDDSRALTPGDAPDFEAYRERLNESLDVGSVTTGQEDFWLRVEAERECRRMDNDWRDKGGYRPKRWRPYGDPGPGLVARVAERQPRAKRCKFRWERESRSWDNDAMIQRVAIVPDDELLNVDAYTPGDFRQFFDDPRTRADYLKWAPLLLEAEEYHAGNREIGKPRKGSDW